MSSDRWSGPRRNTRVRVFRAVTRVDIEVAAKRGLVPGHGSRLASLGRAIHQEASMGVRVECDWCRQAIAPGDPYVTVEVDGRIIRGARGNEPIDVAAPARVYCGLDRYLDDDPAGRAMGWNEDDWGHRESCARRLLTVLAGLPAGRVDAGMEWRLVPVSGPRVELLIDAPLAALDLRSRTRAALDRAGVATVHELALLTEAQWRGVKGIGRAGAADIRRALHKHRHATPQAIIARSETTAT